MVILGGTKEKRKWKKSNVVAVIVFLYSSAPGNSLCPLSLSLSPSSLSAFQQSIFQLVFDRTADEFAFTHPWRRWPRPLTTWLLASCYYIEIIRAATEIVSKSHVPRPFGSFSRDSGELRSQFGYFPANNISRNWIKKFLGIY